MVYQPRQSLVDVPDATRDRLIAAAGEVFAEKGFKDATIREICAQAGANVAAVNYHFRDKGGLYAAVLRSTHEQAEQAYPFEIDGRSMSDAPARDQLRAFVVIMMQRMMDSGKPAWHGQLMAREMVEPTSALDGLVEQTIRPKKEILVGIVRAVMGEHVPQSVIEACARSVIGQAIFYRHNRPVIERLFPGLRYDAPGVRAMAEHIAEFSLSAMDALARGKERP